MGNTKDWKFPHLLIQLKQSPDVQVRSAEGVFAGGRPRQHSNESKLGEAK
jgi:hypothetical protein